MPKKDSLTNNSLGEKHLKEKYGGLKLKGGFNAQLGKAIDPLTIKEVKKALGLKDQDIARMFGYKNVMSYRNAKDGKKRLDSGIVSLYNQMPRNSKVEIETLIDNQSRFYVEHLLLSIELLKLELKYVTKIHISDDTVELAVNIESDNKNKSDVIIINDAVAKFKGYRKC